jgi:hypothetical protein
MCRLWMIHFWMIENHYPDRVMQQFNLFQQVPPSAPINYQQVLTYHKNKHTSGGSEGHNVDWAQYYWWAQDEPKLPIAESRPYDFAQYYTYMGWLNKIGMVTIWYRMNTEKQLSRSLLHPEESVDELAYIPYSHQNV